MVKRIGGPRDPEQPDGRQSNSAVQIARGTTRLLKSLEMDCLAELSLPNQRRADLTAIGDKGTIWIIEIKSSLVDFQTDHKWLDYRDYCDQFYFAINAEFAADVLPADVGIIIADRYGAEIVRAAPEHLLSAARRKAMTLRFARMAARRLTAILDPDAALEPNGRR